MRSKKCNKFGQRDDKETERQKWINKESIGLKSLNEAKNALPFILTVLMCFERRRNKNKNKIKKDERRQTC